MILHYIFIGVTLFILIWLSYSSSRAVKDYEDFNLAGRRTKLFPLVASLTSSELNTATLIGGASVAYSFGTVGMWYTSIVFFMIFGVYAFTVARPYRRLKISTVPQYFDRRFNSHSKISEPLRILATILSLIYPWFAPASYLAGLSVIGSIFLGVNPVFFATTVVIICLILSLAGGLVTSIRIDVFAFILMAIAIPIMFIIGVNAAGGFGNLSDVYEPKLLSMAPVWDTDVNFPIALTWGLQITFMFIGLPSYAQRAFSAKSDKIAFTAMIINMFLVVILYAFVVLATMLSKVVMPNLASPEEALPLLIVNHSSPLIQAFLLIALLMIAVGTLIAVWNGAVSVVINDIVKRYLIKNKNDNYYINLSRVVLVAIALCTVILGIFFIGSVQASLLYLSVFAGIVAMPILISLYWKRYNTIAALLTMIVGLIYSLITLIMNLPLYYVSPIAAVLSLLTGIIVTILTTNKENPDIDEEFYKTIKTSD